MADLFWLLQGEGDGGADQLKGAVLVGGGFGEHGHGGLGRWEADLVAGEGGQVGEQAAEAAVGVAGLVMLGRCLGLGVDERWARGDGAGRLERVLVGEVSAGPRRGAGAR